MSDWLRLALSWNVVRRALIIAAIVGPVLVLINQGDLIFFEHGDRFSWAKAALTFLVPYLVSTVSSVSALRNSAACTSGRRP